MHVSHLKRDSGRRGRGRGQGQGRGRSWSVAAAAAIAVGGMVSVDARAGTFNWDGTAGNWSDANHWGGTAPASDATNVLQFPTGAGDYVSTFDLAGGFQLNQLTLAADAGRTNAITA